MKSSKISVFSLKGLIAGSLLAGALGLGLSQPGSPYGGGAPLPGDNTMGKEEIPVPGSVETALPPNVAPGWKIRICSEKTKAEAIKFQLSHDLKKSGKDMMGGDKSKASEADVSKEFTTWKKGEPTLINVPGELREVEKLRIEAVPSEKNQESSVCVLYNDHVTKKLNFDDREVSTIGQTESGECGC